jgi:hypothetical protein
MECIAISRPLNTKVPSPNAETLYGKVIVTAVSSARHQLVSYRNTVGHDTS